MLKDKEGKINELSSDKSKLENYTKKTLHAVQAKCVPAPPQPRRHRSHARAVPLLPAPRLSLIPI